MYLRKIACVSPFCRAFTQVVVSILLKEDPSVFGYTEGSFFCLKTRKATVFPNVDIFTKFLDAKKPFKRVFARLFYLVRDRKSVV